LYNKTNGSVQQKATLKSWCMLDHVTAQFSSFASNSNSDSFVLWLQ